MSMNTATLMRIVKDAGLETVFHVYPPDAVTLGRQLGSGGFASVFKGLLKLSADVGDRQVAIKVVHPGVEMKQLELFFQEARAALSITGVYVCQPLGATVYDGRPAFILPLFEGNVHNFVDEEYPNGLPLWLALNVMRRVAHGILDMHTKSVIHLDLKPLNVLVNGHFDEIAIADFGMSTSYTSTLAPSKPDMGDGSGGTAPYMSPEQLDSKIFGKPGPKSDVWSLACVFLQLCTNQVPQGGKTLVEMYMDVVVKRAAPPIPTSLPPDVAQLLQQMLQIEPKDRPTSVEVVNRLDQLVETHAKPGEVRHCLQPCRP